MRINRFDLDNLTERRLTDPGAKQFRPRRVQMFANRLRLMQGACTNGFQFCQLFCIKYRSKLAVLQSNT